SMLMLVPVGQRPEAATVAAAPRLAAPVDDPRHAVIGIIDNTKAGAKGLLELLAERLIERGVGGSYITHSKPEGAGMRLSEDARPGMLARAHMVLTGVGD